MFRHVFGTSLHSFVYFNGSLVSNNEKKTNLIYPDIFLIRISMMSLPIFCLAVRK